MLTRKVILMLYCFLNIGNFLVAQQIIKGKILDANTNQPIPYVNIGVKNLEMGTVSNVEGYFEFSTATGDYTILCSAIGYESLEILTSALNNDNTIFLHPKAYLIDSINIEAKHFSNEEKMFGEKNETRGKAVGFGSSQLGTEIGALIKIERPTYIKSANFVIVHAKGDRMLFRVNIYKYKDGIITENILTENILIDEKQRKGTISIDLTPYDLVLEHDVLLALEWIQDDKAEGNTGLTFDTKKSKDLKGVYMKLSSLREFEKMPIIKNKLKPCFYFIGKEELQ